MFKTAVTKIAHNSTIPAFGGNQPLQDLIAAEKALLISLQKLSTDFSKASEALRTWGLSEGDDLGDILGASAAVLNHFSAALSQYAAHGQGMREQLKGIRAKDESFDEMKRRRRTVFRKADDADKKLSRMGPENKNLQMQTDLLNRLQDEVRSLDSDLVVEEAALGDFKRSATKMFMGLKFGGLLECCQKGLIAATFGKTAVSDISEERTQPGLHRPFYQGQQKTERLVAESHRAVSNVTLTTIPTLDFPDRRTYHNDRDPPFIPAVQDEKPIPVPKDSSDHPEFAPPAVVTFANDVQSSSQPSQRQNLNPWSETQVVGSPAFPLPQERSSIDDFGMNLVRTPSGPTGLNNGPGGRFATFPVKSRPAASPPPPPPLPMFTLDPLPLQTSHELGPSFASSIADAFEHNHNPDSVTDNTTGSNAPSGPLPLPSISIKSSVSTNPWADATEERSRAQVRNSNLSDNDEALLAYLMSGDEEVVNSADYKSLQISDKNISSEIQDQRVQEERPGESSNQELQSDKPASMVEDKLLSGSSSLGGPLATGMMVEREDGSKLYEGPSTLETGSSKLETVSLSSSQLSSEEHEKALNAAAAREISFELEALNASRSLLPSDTVQRGRTRVDTGRSYGSPENAGRDSPPLAPPSAPFARRAVSPHPSHEQSLITSPGIHLYGSQQPTSPFPIPLGQPQVNQYSGGLSPSQAYHSYRSQPPHSPLSGSPITERSSYMTNPLNSSGGVSPGSRTISAAAFKKRRMSMDNLPKGLPGSPYPVGTPRILSASGTPVSEQLEKRLPQFEYDNVDPYLQTSSTSRADRESRSLPRADGYQTGNFSTDLEEGALR